jgi:hypothetical protein
VTLGNVTNKCVPNICVAHHFPRMAWEWNPSLFPIHVYYFQLWEDNYKKQFYEICENFLVPMYVIIYKQNPIRISTESMQAIKEIWDWYIGKQYAYIRIYGSTGAPHRLPKYILEKLLIREIAYQTMEVGITTILSTNSKRYWLISLITIGEQTLTSLPHSKKDVESLKELLWSVEKPRKYDPKGIVEIHLKYVGLVHPILHEEKPQECIFKGTVSFEESLFKIRYEHEKETILLLEEYKQR